MNFIELLLLALSLSMDAFAVAICRGLALKTCRLRDMWTVGLYFGMFQAGMPLLGYYLGATFYHFIEMADGIVPPLVLCVIGGHMIKESRQEEEEQGEKTDGLPGCTTMLFLALATSIDAFAVGVTLVMLAVPVFSSVALIGTVTFFCSALGVQIGHLFGLKYKSKAEFLGGFILIAMAIKFAVADFL